MSKTFHRKHRGDDDERFEHNPNRRRVWEEKRKMKEYNVYDEPEKPDSKDHI